MPWLARWRYNGKPIVNSVSGKKSSLEAILPLVARYGGVVVGLTLDDAGIPETATGRLAVARTIVGAAEAFGIPKKNVVIDPLTLTIGSDPQAAVVTLEALRLIKSELGVRTVLGVSNVSFGLPERGLLNAGFLLMALDAGLDFAILNPNAVAMMDAVAVYRLLSGQDEQAQRYAAYVKGRQATSLDSRRDAVRQSEPTKSLSSSEAYGRPIHRKAILQVMLAVLSKLTLQNQ